MDPLPHFLHSQDGEIRLVGSRIGLFHVVKAWTAGATAEQIALEYPTAPLADIEQTVAYYRAHTAEVDEYVRGYQAELDARYTAGRKLTLDELRAKCVAATGGRP